MRMAMALLGMFVCAQLTAQTISRGLTAANGHFIGFLEFRPTDYASSPAKHPLIIFLHGVGEKGNGTTQLKDVNCCGIPAYIRRGFNMKATWNGKTESFVMLTPQLSPTYGAWQSYYVNELISYAIRELRIDPDRIFVTGLSMGGGGTWIYASESLSNAKRLAGIVPVVGPCQMTNGCNIANADLPVLAIHSRDDKTASPNCTLNALKEINGCGAAAPTNLIMYPNGGHSVWVKRAFDTEHEYQNPNVYEWMLAQNRSLAPNKKPQARAGGDMSVSGSVGSVTLSGGSSGDADGRIVRYIWRKISGPSDGVISNPNQVATTVTSLNKDGNYKYELKVVDDRADWSLDTVTVYVGKGGPVSNAAPVADAGTNLTIKLPQSNLTLDGSGSYDADGSIVTYAWTKLSGPSATISKPSTAITEVNDLVEGKYVFALKVTDDDELSSSDQVTITVKKETQGTGNELPVARAGNNITVSLPENSVVLDGESSTDADGKISKYQWSYVSGPSKYTIENKNAATTDVNDLVKGKYEFKLVVTDDQGATDDDRIIVQVNASSGNTPNIIPEAQAGPDQNLHLPVTKYLLNGEGSVDPDGTIEKYKWELVDGPENTTIEDASKEVAYVEDMQLGTYEFRLTVTDNKGKKASDVMTINVLAALNAAPVAMAGVDTTISSENNFFVLDGSESYDGDGNIENYSWRMISGPANCKIEKWDAASTKINNAGSGDYAFELTVTDNKSAVAIDTVKIKYKLVEEYAGVYLYPNPANNNIHVRIAGEEEGQMQITIYDVNGSVVMDRYLVKNGYLTDQDIDIINFKSGMYYVKITSHNHTRVTKFIRQP